jgi:hypothetical protein
MQISKPQNNITIRKIIVDFRSGIWYNIIIKSKGCGDNEKPKIQRQIKQ